MRTGFYSAARCPEAEPQELQLGICNTADLRFLLVEFQEQLSFYIGFEVFKGAFRRFSALAEDNHVVGVPNEAMSPAFELVVELVEHDIGENGAYRSALWRSYLARCDLVAFLDRRSQDFVDE